MKPHPAHRSVSNFTSAPRTLDKLLGQGIIAADDWEGVPADARQRLCRCTSIDVLLSLLVAHGVLSEFQANAVRDGKCGQLVVGSYRLKRALGEDKRGKLYEGEHIHLRRPVRVRVLPSVADSATISAVHIMEELRALARISQRHLLTPIDAGRTSIDESTHVYVVFEGVSGTALGKYMAEHGPLAPDAACRLTHQAASALAAIHECGLAHRDLTPSSIMVTSDRQAKVVDVGLTRRNPSQVLADEIAADIFALGGLLYWCVTGQNAGCSLGTHPLVPPALEGIIARARSDRTNIRFASATALMHALAPLQASAYLHHATAMGSMHDTDTPHAPEVLIVDDDPEIRNLCRSVLETEGIRCDEADCGAEALRMTEHLRYDLVLLDMAMPGMSGDVVCRKLRAHPPCPNLKVLFFSGHMSSDDLAGLLSAGADDYVTKPFTVVQLLARIKAALRLKEAQDRANDFHHHILGANMLLEQNLQARDFDVVEAHKALVLAMAKLVECRDRETGAHVKRLQAYCRRLAEEAAFLPAFAVLIDAEFIHSLEWCAPLHDIGKAGIPDAILQKPGPLTCDERQTMQRHTLLGADTLAEVARQHGSGMGFLRMAIDIARHHHERFDGKGYPDALADHDIPLSARLVAIADVYDALRSRRVYKQAISHDVAVQTILEESSGQFDPALLQAFARCAQDFDRIFCESAA